MKNEGTNWFYRSISAMVRLWAACWFRIEYIGRENIPADGSCIVASNHVSFLDPPLVGAAIEPYRAIRFIARASLRNSRASDWVLRKLLTIPIERDKGDLKAMRTVLNYLKNDSVIGLFPEGTRSSDGNLKEAKGGIGFMICKSKVPVLPVYIDGSYAALSRGQLFARPRKIRIYFGSLIPVQELEALGTGKEQYATAGAYIMQKIAALKPV